MLVFKKSKALRLVLALLILVSPELALADFSVKAINARLTPGKILLSGDLDLALSEKVEEAVSKGIPLDIDIELKLYQTRPILWAKRISEWTLRRQIRYHALSGQYLVSEKKDGVENLENFTSLPQALLHMGNLNDLELSLEQDTPFEHPLVLEARASLDIESLPAPLRPVAYTSLEWHLNSGWTEWNVQQQ